MMKKIKDWFMDKNFSPRQREFIQIAAFNDKLTVIEESEKAVRFKAIFDGRCMEFWCPKSCIETVDTTASTVKTDGLNYNEALLKLAKENGVKGVRKGMKTVTLISKLAAAGIEIPER